MKRRLKNFITAILFLAVFLIAFQMVTKVFRQKAGRNDTIGSFYKEKKDSMDVIFVGSSHVYRAFNPMVAWNESGIASYNLGTVSQSIPCSYYLIKEAIRTQHPEVIVLEAYGASYTADYVEEARVHSAFDGMPLNKTKIELLTEFLPNTMETKDIVGYALPLVGMHSRWEELQTEDFVPNHLFMKGYQYIEATKEVAEPTIYQECTEIYERNLLYFDKIIELCKENDVNLVLTVTPMGDSDRYEKLSGRINTLLKYAEEKGIPCVNMDLLREDVGIEYEHDFYNSDHVNAFGGEKCTKYIVQYLKEHYDLADHRNDVAYVSWAKAYQEYITYLSKEFDATENDNM